MPPRLGANLAFATSEGELIRLSRSGDTILNSSAGIEGLVVRLDLKVRTGQSFSLRGMHNLRVLTDLAASLAIS